MIRIYTDGACSQKNHSGRGPGGWAYKVIFDHYWTERLSGYHPDTTNNRMELQAAIEGIKYVEDPSQKIELYSDSAYLINCFQNGWYKKWRQNGWLTSSRKPVENQDQWKSLLEFVEKHEVTFVKVKGHSTNEHNNECDQMAVEEIAKHR